MLINHSDGTLFFSVFAEFPEMDCFFTTRKQGDLTVGKKSISDNVRKFLSTKRISGSFLGMEQIHGADVVRVDQTVPYEVSPKTDGIITIETNVFLGVNTADCVPLFFYDPVKKIVGAAHAGWKGTIGFDLKNSGNFAENIVTNVIHKLQDIGSDPKNIRVAIGPHIGGCCYSAPEERAAIFIKKFNNDRMAFRSEGSWYIDLGLANKHILINTGILDEHIDAPIACTSCQNDQYFSFRKDGKIMGEMLGVIGMKGQRRDLLRQ